MAEQDDKDHYMKSVMRFYFTPHPRAALTVLFILIYGYFVLYYINDAHLAERFIIYTLTSGTALLSIEYLFWYTSFVMTLLAPFIVSAYAIFVLYESWHEKRKWESHFRTLMTVALVVGSIFLIVFTNNMSRVIARQDALKTFITNNNLSGRI